MPKVFLSGYAKLPENTTAQKLYNHLVLVVTVQTPQGTILDADCTMATQLGRQFIQELLAGYDLHRGPEPLTALLAQWRRSRRRTVRVGEQRARVLGPVGASETILDVTNMKCAYGDLAVFEMDPLFARGFVIEYR